MFFGSEQRRRSQCFDLLREDTARALRIKQIAYWLGGSGGFLLSINRDAYLPNIRSGRAYTPRKYQNKTHATAILPVAVREAKRITKMVQPITTNYLPPRHVPGEVFYRGLDRHISRQDLLRRWNEYQHTPRPERADIQGFNNLYSATIRVGTWLSPNGKQARISHPVEAILQDDMHTAWQRAITGTHMHNHADDIISMGAASTLPENAGMSELRSNHVTWTVHNRFGLRMPTDLDDIEYWRQQNASRSCAYIHNPRIVAALEVSGVALPHYPL